MAEVGCIEGGKVDEWCGHYASTLQSHVCVACTRSLSKGTSQVSASVSVSTSQYKSDSGIK